MTEQTFKDLILIIEQMIPHLLKIEDKTLARAAIEVLEKAKKELP
jgi:hypothetical protein